MNGLNHEKIYGIERFLDFSNTAREYKYLRGSRPTRLQLAPLSGPSPWHTQDYYRFRLRQPLTFSAPTLSKPLIFGAP
jgi:hypothetical protein